MHVFFGLINCSLVIFFQNNKAFLFFACQKEAAGVGAALKKAAPALSSGQLKNRLRLHPKSGGSRSATLIGTVISSTTFKRQNY